MPRKLLILALLVCGCGTYVNYTPLRRVARGEPRSPQSVDVYLTSPPTEPHVDVGILEAEQESDLSLDDTREMLIALRKEAGRRGCDAIFVKGFGTNTSGGVFTTAVSSTKTITATCIHYTEDERSVAQRARR